MLALPVFPGRPTYCPAEEALRWSVSGRIRICAKRTSLSTGASVCVGITYLPGQSPAKYCRRT